VQEGASHSEHHQQQIDGQNEGHLWLQFSSPPQRSAGQVFTLVLRVGCRGRCWYVASRRAKDVQPLRRRDGEVNCNRTAMEGWKENISRPTVSSTQIIRLLREQQAGPLTLRAKTATSTPLENKVPERIMAERALPSSRTYS